MLLSQVPGQGPFLRVTNLGSNWNVLEEDRDKNFVMAIDTIPNK